MQDSAQLWKEREVIFSQFAGLAQVGQNVCLSRRRSLRPKPFWLSKSDRLDYLRYADLNEAVRAADASREVTEQWLLVD